MRSEDLMVGDWFAFQGRPYRITADDIATLADCEKNGAQTSVSEIPITKEILEKNGFEKQGFPGWEIYTKEYMILWRNDYPDILTIESFTSRYGSFKMHNVRYVHELQHALRLCGIQKEIEEL